MKLSNSNRQGSKYLIKNIDLKMQMHMGKSPSSQNRSVQESNKNDLGQQKYNFMHVLRWIQTFQTAAHGPD